MLEFAEQAVSSGWSSACQQVYVCTELLLTLMPLLCWIHDAQVQEVQV